MFIWNNQRIQSANRLISHSYIALAEHSLVFDFPGGPETSIWNNFCSHTLFYTRWSDHLGISMQTNSQNSHPFVSHIICGVIIWKSQSIQTLKTRTRVHNTSLLSTKWSYFLAPNQKEFAEVSSAWTATITNLRKQSEVSRDGMFSFLGISAWCPPICHYHKS